MLQMAAAVTQAGGIFPPLPPITTNNITEETSTPNSNPTRNEDINNTSTTSPITSTTAPSLSNEEKDNRKGQVESNEEGNTRENMGKALMQLYGMGQGMNSFPTGVSQANPFLHPTMFSATGKCIQ